MRSGWARFVLGVELAAEEPGMAFQFDDLDKLSVGGEAGHVESALLELRHIFRIHFVAMAMALVDQIAAVGLVRDRALLQPAWIFPEAHSPAESVDANEIAQLVDDFVRRLIVELRRVRASHPA